MADFDRSLPLIRMREIAQGPNPGLGKVITGPVRRDGQFSDLEGRIITASYKDVAKGADTATIDINNIDLRFPDDPLFDIGETFLLVWGYAGNTTQREITVKTWTPGEVFKVEAIGKAALMNKKPVDATYFGTSMSEVAKKIAERNGYSAAAQIIEPSKVILEHLPQPNITDGEMLREMAQELGWLYFVDAQGIFHFHPRNFAEPPRRTWTWRSGTIADLTAFPALKPKPPNAPSAVTVKGVDPKTKKPIEARADNESTKRDGLASVLELLDTKTATTSLVPGAASKEIVVATSAKTQAEAKAQAAALYKRAVISTFTGTMSVVGDPQFAAKCVVAVGGIGERMGGNYFADDVTHQISAGDYKMSVTVHRDGTSSSTSGGVASKATANTTPGPADGGKDDALKAVEVLDTKTATTHVEYRPKP